MLSKTVTIVKFTLNLYVFSYLLDQAFVENELVN